MPKRCFRVCAAETSVENCGFDHHTPNEFVKSQVSFKAFFAHKATKYRYLPYFIIEVYFILQFYLSLLFSSSSYPFRRLGLLWPAKTILRHWSPIGHIWCSWVCPLGRQTLRWPFGLLRNSMFGARIGFVHLKLFTVTLSLGICFYFWKYDKENDIIAKCLFGVPQYLFSCKLYEKGT